MSRSRALLYIALFLGVACREVDESHYATVAAVRQADDSRQGWLPPFLPESATDIREKHDIAANWTFVRFRFTAPLADPSTCTVIPRSTLPSPSVRGHLTPSWWPSPLPESPSVRTLTCTEPTYGTSTAPTWLVIDDGAATAYFWRDPS